MKQRSSVQIFVFSAATYIFASVAERASPLQKVISLITNLQGQVIREGDLSQQSFTKYSSWCEKTSQEKQFEIEQGKQASEELAATIDKCKSDAADAEARVEALSGKLATDEADVKAITLIRNKEQGDFEAMDKELSTTVSTLARARSVLAKEMDKAGLKAGAFLQKPTKGMQIFLTAVGQLVNTAQGVSADSKESLSDLLQLQDGAEDQDQEESTNEESNEDSDADGADDQEAQPKVAAYKAKSAPIMKALENMAEEAQKAQAKLRKEEARNKHSYELLKSRLEDRIKTQTKELDEQKTEVAESKEKLATSMGKLASVVKDLKEDQKYLKKLQQGCMERAAEFEMEVKSRKDELQALASAKKTVQSIVFTQTPSTYTADSSVPSFLQLGSGSEMEVSRHQFALRTAGNAVSMKLKQMAMDERSAALAQLSSHVARTLKSMGTKGQIGADPFKEVKKMIQNMIVKMEKQQNKDAAQKKFCDTQMAQTKASKKDREGTIETLSTKIEGAVADIAKLNQQRTMLLSEIKDIETAQAEMDEMRKTEHDAYGKVTKEMKEGLAAVQTALKVLRDFYSQDDDKGSFIQDMGNSMRTVAVSTYAGSGGGTAIIGLLEVIESDFSKGMAETQSEEDAAQDEFEKLTTANKKEKTVKNKSVSMIGSEVARLQKKKSELAGDRSETQQELDAILEYFEKITKQCVAKPENYHERVARREREIKGLEEALAMLEGEADE